MSAGSMISEAHTVPSAYVNNTNTANEAFYFTTASANGGPYDLPPGDGLGPVTNKMAFPGINLSVVANLSFTVAANNGSVNAPVSWVVQLNNNSWYVSTNTFTEIGLTFQTFTMNFNPSIFPPHSQTYSLTIMLYWARYRPPFCLSSIRRQ